MLKTLTNSAGKRRTRVEIEIATDAASSSSTSFAVNPEYSTTFTRFAEVMMTSGREFQQAMQTVPMLNGILKLSYDSKTAAISARDRVRIGSRILNISAPAINEGGRNETVVLWLIEPELPA